jgi:hypothetical protein
MLRIGWAAAATAGLAGLLLQAAVPTSWTFSGSKPQEYDCSVDSATQYSGLPSVYIKSKPGVKTTGFGSMMQDFTATQYSGKRIRLSANLKSDGVTEWGGLWMRVDDANHPRNGYPRSVAFDNMHDGLEDRSVKGTTGWKNYSVVLDVPEGATGIYIGVLLSGPGTLWVNSMKFEIVGTDVAVTGRQQLNGGSCKGPTNIGFEK